jgi:hypothetical protein
MGLMNLLRGRSTKGDGAPTILDGGDNTFIRVPSDVVVEAGRRMRSRTRKVWLHPMRAAGFGRKSVAQVNLTDVNGDGRTFLEVRAPENVEAIVREPSGKVVFTVASGVERVSRSELPAGTYHITFREV